MIQTSFLSRLANAPSTNIQYEKKLILKNRNRDSKHTIQKYLCHRKQRSVTQYNSIKIKFNSVLKKFNVHVYEKNRIFVSSETVIEGYSETLYNKKK